MADAAVCRAAPEPVPHLAGQPETFSYEKVREALVIINRMTGYDEEDISEYLENSFESLLWDWGYFALLAGF